MITSVVMEDTQNEETGFPALNTITTRRFISLSATHPPQFLDPHYQTPLPALPPSSSSSGGGSLIKTLFSRPSQSKLAAAAAVAAQKAAMTAPNGSMWTWYQTFETIHQTGGFFGESTNGFINCVWCSTRASTLQTIFSTIRNEWKLEEGYSIFPSRDSNRLHWIDTFHTILFTLPYVLLPLIFDYFDD
jgi:hypothetical protein